VWWILMLCNKKCLISGMCPSHPAAACWLIINEGINCFEEITPTWVWNKKKERGRKNLNKVFGQNVANASMWSGH
jgi:hypothetical protein